MSPPQRFPCPHCDAVIKSNRPIADQSAITCPQCRQSFIYHQPIDIEAIDAWEVAPPTDDRDPWDVDDGPPDDQSRLDQPGFLDDLSETDGDLPLEPPLSKSKKRKNKKTKGQPTAARRRTSDSPGVLSRAVVLLGFLGTALVVLGGYLWFQQRPRVTGLPDEPPQTLYSLFEQQASITIDQDSHILGVRFSSLELSPDRLQPLLVCRNIKQLHFVNCEFTDPACVEILGQLTGLEEVSLIKTSGITSLHPLEKLTRVRGLTLEGCGLAPMNLAKLPELQTLKIHDYRDGLKEQLPQLKKLHTLDIMIGAKRSESLVGVGLCPSLRRLTLSQAYPEQLSALRPLSHLESCKIEVPLGPSRYPGVEYMRLLESMTHLKSIHISNMGDLTPECFHWLGSHQMLDDVFLDFQMGTARLEEMGSSGSIQNLVLQVVVENQRYPQTTLPPLPCVQQLTIHPKLLPEMKPQDWPALRVLSIRESDHRLMWQVADFPNLKLFIPELYRD